MSPDKHAAAALPRRIGVFGGAFDPPHRAHVALAEAAVQQLGLDELRIVPTGQAWHKDRTLSAKEHRLAMAELAFAGLAHVVVDPRELLREGPSFTIETLEALKAENPESLLFLVIGGDQFAAFRQWKRWQDILALATVCIAQRAPVQGAQPGPGTQGVDFEGFLKLDLPLMPISATQIRHQIASGMLSPQAVCEWVPETVARYISTHRLYTGL